MVDMFGYEVDVLCQIFFQEIYFIVDEFECIGLCLVLILNEKGFYLDECIMKCFNDEMFWCYVIGYVFNCDNLYVVGIWIFEDVSVKCFIVFGLILCECEIVVLLVEGKISKFIVCQVELSLCMVEMYCVCLMCKFVVFIFFELVYKLLSIMF